eukprot:4801397-Amphidinium_carterae.1
MDSQLPYLSTYASTASRLSQRLIISIAVTNGFELKTVDISTAFLQGFSWKRMDSILRDLRVPKEKMHRQCFITVPGNVWFHLRKHGLKGDDSGCW